MRLRDSRGDDLGNEGCRLVRGFRWKRQIDMKPARSGCLEAGMKSELVENFLHPPCHLYHPAERRPRSRVQVDNRVVRKIERLHSRMPRIDRYAAKLNSVEK